MVIINKRAPHSLSVSASAAKKNIFQNQSGFHKNILLEGLSYEWVELQCPDCVPQQPLQRWIKLPLICYVSGKDEIMFMGSPMDGVFKDTIIKTTLPPNGYSFFSYS